jgi:uncharacterized protein
VTDQGASAELYVRTFLLKVAARCNINCTYCYEFNLADSSWRHKPRTMSNIVVESAIRRIYEHVVAHNLRAITIIFHGGEPLLAGMDIFGKVLQQCQEVIGDRCKIRFALQTNGTLLNREWLDFFLTHSINVGLSIDGDKFANDRFRLDHRGQSTFAATERGLTLLSQPRYRPIRGGLLSVIHPENDPLQVFDWLCSWDAPPIDFLFPLHNHVNKPPFPFDPEGGYGFGRWLSKIFDKWYGEDMHRVKIRTFEDIMHLMLGGVHAFESYGLSAVRLAVIQTDGAYEAVDSLKSTYDGAVATGRTVLESSVDDLVGAPLIGSRLDRRKHLCEQCTHCELVRVCGAGYIPNRYHPVYGFLAPSIYCHDLTFLIRHIEKALRRDGDSTIREAVTNSLTPLETTTTPGCINDLESEQARRIGVSDRICGPKVYPR